MIVVRPHREGFYVELVDTRDMLEADRPMGDHAEAARLCSRIGYPCDAAHLRALRDVLDRALRPEAAIGEHISGFIVPQCFVCGGKDEPLVLDFRHEHCDPAVQRLIAAAVELCNKSWLSVEKLRAALAALPQALRETT